jgi:hypothetical protein
MIVSKLGLPDIDGFMTPGDLAKIVEYPHASDHFEFETKELI